MQKQIKTFLDSYQNQALVVDFGQADVSKQVQIQNETVNIAITLGYPVQTIKSALLTDLYAKLQAIVAPKKIDIQLDWRITPHAVQQGLKGLASVKNIIAVASGKGGVGKSTTAVNLALALQAEGAQVGVLDADIYGPNQPQMLGAQGEPEQVEKKLLPLVCHGLQSMSIGYLLAQEDTPMIWRGPMVSTALQQLLRDTIWQDLDYLIIDLPPGTGDIQLTLVQKIPVSGAIIVTTPQDVATLDAKKALRMFEKVNVPILGVIENMSLHVCSQCGHQDAIFGAAGGKKIAKQFGAAFLGALPLVSSIRAQADSGKPTVVAEPTSEIAQTYQTIARKMAANLARQKRDFAKKFPKIVVEDK